MMNETGCDGVMIARGARGNPWIFAEAAALLENKAYTPPTLEERLGTALSHAAAIVAYKGERAGIPESRKHMAWYLSGVRGVAAARDAVMSACSLEDLREIFDGVLRQAEEE